MATDLTDEELNQIEYAIYAGEGAENRSPVNDMLRLITEVRRRRAELGACDECLHDAHTELDMANSYASDLAAQVAELRDALDALVANQGCQENGEYDTQAARDAEALLDRMDHP